MKSINQVRVQLDANSPELLKLDGKKHAVVAMIIKFSGDEPEVLMIERAHHEKDPWSGHLALPGGRVESQDAKPQDTAERETWEEIGVQLDGADLLGRLPDVRANNISITVSCFVYRLTAVPEFKLAPAEVADAFWFPLNAMNDPARAITIKHDTTKGHKSFPAVKVPGKSQPLWGITYKLLQDFLSIMPAEFPR
jgi:8-oxo-dGTP pyrophosphatase MutT (NUDIX family)